MDESQKYRKVKEEIRSLEMMVDYAIIEGVNLKIPFVVYLLQMVQVELSSVKNRKTPPIDDPKFKFV